MHLNREGLRASHDEGPSCNSLGVVSRLPELKILTRVQFRQPSSPFPQFRDPDRLFDVSSAIHTRLGLLLHSRSVWIP